MNDYKIGDVVVTNDNKEHIVMYNDGYKIHTKNSKILVKNVKGKVGILLMNGEVSYKDKDASSVRRDTKRRNKNG